MGQKEKSVHCVHPRHLGNSLIPEDKIKCQTWAMPDGVCNDCCISKQPPHSIETAGAWMFSKMEGDCDNCPARGY